jgi:molecular chaperone GrpE (heat shock protein)
MGWFKRWFRKEDDLHTELSNISASIDDLSEAVSANESGTQKGLRRLSMAQKQQSEAIALLTQESTSLKFALAQRNGLTLTYEQILHTLDSLAKVNHAANNAAPQEIIAPLTARVIEDLLPLCELAIIAEIGKPYPDQGCKVVGATDTSEKPQWPPGTVVEVLQQGYQTTAGDVVRTAKVIVSRETSTLQSIRQTEETGNGD